MKTLFNIFTEGKKIKKKFKCPGCGKKHKLKESVGIFIIAKDTNNFLLLHRVNSPLVWGLLSGSMDKKGEQPYDTLVREIGEELGVNPSIVSDIRQLGSFQSKKTMFHLYAGFVEHEMDFPNLDTSENDDYAWHNETNLPSPIHHRWEQSFHLLKHLLDLRESIKGSIKSLINGR